MNKTFAKKLAIDSKKQKQSDLKPSHILRKKMEGTYLIFVYSTPNHDNLSKVCKYSINQNKRYGMNKPKRNFLDAWST